MKQIGHIDGATSEHAWRTHSLGMLAPHDLFIPNPGERENIDAEAFEHVGWVNPDADGGAIYAHHRDASEDGDARPAYVRRTQEPAYVIRFTDEPVIGEIDPMDVRRSEFDALSKRIDEIDVRLNRHTLLLPKPSIDTEPSDLFHISTDDLIKEALEFCDNRLDQHKNSISAEDAYPDCNKANVYIRELIGRLHGARQPKPAPTVQAEQPMSFYDHAFIAAYMVLRSAEYDDVTHMQRAHTIAAKLTRNRAVPA